MCKYKYGKVPQNHRIGYDKHTYNTAKAAFEINVAMYTQAPNGAFICHTCYETFLTLDDINNHSCIHPKRRKGGLIAETVRKWRYKALGTWLEKRAKK